MYSRFFAVVSFSFITLVALAGGTAGDEQSRREWSGKVEQGALLGRAPHVDFITDPHTWRLVWKSWRGDQPVPEIDFNSRLILIATMPGPNRVDFEPVIEESNVQFVPSGTLAGGPGFGYKLLAIDRKGVKTVNGIPIEGSGFINVRLSGQLRTGLAAIGGETTGTTITSRGITWELDFGRRSHYLDKLEELNGKTVYVTGGLYRKPGVEIQDRLIVSVSAMSEMTP